jgi:hypothetical protein
MEDHDRTRRAPMTNGLGHEWRRTAVPTLLSSDFDGAQQSLTVSLVALTSAVLATLVGFPAAYALAPLRFPGRGLLEVVVSLPLVFPAVSFAIGLLILLEATGSTRPRRHWTTWMAGISRAMEVCAGDGRSSGLEKARCGDPDGNEYRAGLIQNPNAAFWRRELFREFGDLAPYGAQAAEFDRAQRRNRLVVLHHLEIIALHRRLARRPTWRRRRVEPLRALPEWPKDGNLPGDYARQLVFDRAQPEPAVYRKLNINGAKFERVSG